MTFLRLSFAVAGFNVFALVVLFIATRTSFANRFSSPENCIFFLVCTVGAPILLYLNYEFCKNYLHVFTRADGSVWASQFAVWATKWASLLASGLVIFFLFRQTPFVRLGEIVALVLYLLGAWASIRWVTPLSTVFATLRQSIGL